MKADKITIAIIGAAIAVHRGLGPSLLESTYKACLAYELLERRMSIERQKALPKIMYKISLRSQRSLR